jgi:DNA-binding MarR family transcriptional regulator
MYQPPGILRLSVHREAMAEQAPPVAECLAFIRLCRDSLVPLLDRAAGVTPKELRILKDLRSESGDSAAAVAKRLKIDDGEMSRLMKRLAAKDLLTRTLRPNRRTSALTLTPTGRALVDRSNWAEHEVLEALMEELTAEEQARLREAMAVVRELSRE